MRALAMMGVEAERKLGLRGGRVCVRTRK